MSDFSLHTPRGAHLLLTLTALCLAGNHVIARSVHGEIPPVGLSFWRWTVGALILAPFVLPRIVELGPAYRRNMGALTLLGGRIIGSTTVLLIALNFTTALNVSLINAVQPTLTVLLAVVFLKDRINKNNILGIVSALLGVAIMLSTGDWTVLVNLEFNVGDLIALAAMFGFASYALNLRKLPKELSVLESLFGITVAGSILLLPFYVLESMFYATVPIRASTIIVIIALALLVSVFGNLMWNIGNQIIGASRASIFINLIPLFGAILAVTFLGETILVYHVAGAIMICLGVWLVMGDRSRRQTRHNQ
ncbi:MAG: DMT family transporter [Woeseiaceae bacterium]